MLLEWSARNASFPTKGLNGFRILESTVGYYPSKPGYTCRGSTGPSVNRGQHQTCRRNGWMVLHTSGAKGQLSNALRIRAQSLISRFLICFLMSTRSSAGRLGSVSGLRRVWAPGASDLPTEKGQKNQTNVNTRGVLRNTTYPIAAFKLCPFSTNSLLRQ